MKRETIEARTGNKAWLRLHAAIVRAYLEARDDEEELAEGEEEDSG